MNIQATEVWNDVNEMDTVLPKKFMYYYYTNNWQISLEWIQDVQEN